MHELSVCRSLLGQVGRIAAQHHARAVNRIQLQVGALSGVDPALLRQAFPIASVGTLAASAELNIEQIPVCVHCGTCGSEHEAPPNKLSCPVCGSCDTRLCRGDELLLISLDLSDFDSVASAIDGDPYV